MEHQAPYPANFGQRLSWSLLSLRLGVFIVMFIWTLDKFMNPGHSVVIFQKFYSMDASTSIIYLLGVAQLILVVAFLAGVAKRYTYGLILLMHLGSTLASFNQYLDPFKHLLFFAAWPMLGACLTLYLLREFDTKWTLSRAKNV
ncbi:MULTISPECIES: hypothetical protein [unclassified Vibrio]|uniref:DoxX protein n=1 Tax=Vibrio sp. HB236076 TaxID=3232307 RepID=A0AB39HDC4_9VIBR|nr:hypothetical protein [Vibrio sp. HB161653]MDP5254060.1 hypothetical protein [Vibrio sp. HB161653]